VFGEITYSDVFRRSHWTKFCMKLVINTNGATALAPCEIYNEAN